MINNISNKNYYIIQNNIERSELNIKNLGISKRICSETSTSTTTTTTTRTITGLFQTNSESFLLDKSNKLINLARWQI